MICKAFRSAGVRSAVIRGKTPALNPSTRNAIRAQAHALLGTMASYAIINTLYKRYEKRYTRQSLYQLADLPANPYQAQGNRKIKTEDIPEIKQAALQGETYKSIAARYHVTDSAICRIIKDTRQPGKGQPAFRASVIVNGIPRTLTDRVIARVLLLSTPLPLDAKPSFDRWWGTTYRCYQTPLGEVYLEVPGLKAFGPASQQLATLGITATVVKRAVLPPDASEGE